MNNDQSKDLSADEEAFDTQMNVKVPESWRGKVELKSKQGNRQMADQHRMLLQAGFEALYGERLGRQVFHPRFLIEKVQTAPQHEAA